MDLRKIVYFQICASMVGPTVFCVSHCHHVPLISMTQLQTIYSDTANTSGHSVSRNLGDL